MKTTSGEFHRFAEEVFKRPGMYLEAKSAPFSAIWHYFNGMASPVESHYYDSYVAFCKWLEKVLSPMPEQMTMFGVILDLAGGDESRAWQRLRDLIAQYSQELNSRES